MLRSSGCTWRLLSRLSPSTPLARASVKPFTFAAGRKHRSAFKGQEVPTEATIVAIVDEVQHIGE